MRLHMSIDGRYVTEDLLGSGRLGAVYRARMPHIENRLMAVKVLHAELGNDPVAKQRLQDEAQIGVSIRHAAAVDICDFGMTKDRTMYMAMELIVGPTLEQLVRDRGPLPLKRIAHIAVQVAGALDAAHAKQRSHGDLRASKVIVIDDADTIKVIGFHGREPDVRGDQHALADLVYEMATGRRPLTASAPPCLRPSPRPSQLYFTGCWRTSPTSSRRSDARPTRSSVRLADALPHADLSPIA